MRSGENNVEGKLESEEGFRVFMGRGYTYSVGPIQAFASKVKLHGCKCEVKLNEYEQNFRFGEKRHSLGRLSGGAFSYTYNALLTIFGSCWNSSNLPNIGV